MSKSGWLPLHDLRTLALTLVHTPRQQGKRIKQVHLKQDLEKAYLSDSDRLCLSLAPKSKGKWKMLLIHLTWPITLVAEHATGLNPTRFKFAGAQFVQTADVRMRRSDTATSIFTIPTSVHPTPNALSPKNQPDTSIRHLQKHQISRSHAEPPRRIARRRNRIRSLRYYLIGSPCNPQFLPKTLDLSALIHGSLKIISIDTIAIGNEADLILVHGWEKNRYRHTAPGWKFYRTTGEKAFFDVRKPGKKEV